MRIRKFSLVPILFYPVIINPLFAFMLPFGILYVILCEWWEIKKVREEAKNHTWVYYWDFKLKSPRYEFGFMIRSFFSSFFMLYFWNKDYSKAYTNWWLYKYLYFEVDNGYHRPGQDPKDIDSKIEGLTRRERVLNLYCEIFINHKTIWKNK